MEPIFKFFETLSLWNWILIIGECSLFILVIILIFKYSRQRFLKKLERIIQDPRLVDTLIITKYSSKSLLRKSSLIEKFAEKKDSRIIKMIGMDRLWNEQLKHFRQKKDFKKILKFAPEEGLFTCFLISLKKRSFVSMLKKYLDKSGDTFQMRRIGLSGKGEYFNGKVALKLFKKKLPELRELTGDPEWTSRYLAVKILLHDKDDLSLRAIWDGFRDSNHLIRETIAREFKTDEEERLYSEIFKLFIDDPNYHVRKAARERIQKDFTEFYEPDAAKLTEEQIFHMLELLVPGSKEDENLALNYLNSSNLEHRFTAANYLEQQGILTKLCMAVDMGNTDEMNRTKNLLEKAVEVNVLSFLSAIKKTDNLPTLIICAQILQNHGDRSLITELAKKVFKNSDMNKHFMSLYKLTLQCISNRGNEEALRLLNTELQAKRKETDLMTLLLMSIPERGDAIFLETLIEFLKNPEFEPKKVLRDVLLKMPVSIILPEIFQIIKSPKEIYPIQVRREALALLAEMKQDYCLQTILENLYLLPVSESKTIAAVLSKYPQKQLTQKIKILLEKSDAKIRASIISILYVLGDNSFLQSIRNGLKDADPDVRMASVWTLVEFSDSKSLDQATSMLRDPLDRVRQEAALALGTFGSKPIIKQLKQVLFDDNEISSVKKDVIRGLGYASALEVIDILISRLEVDEEHADALTLVLSQKTEKKEIARTMENFKNSEPNLRNKINQVFIKMKEPGEEGLAELLKEGIASLKPYISQVLEVTGFVEKQIRKLSHKDASIRRESAIFLSLIGTASAFRGIVLAARDPDEDVRVEVTKALEKLGTKEGKEILKALEKDPNRRIRKYTHWALERLKSKSL